MRVEGALLRTGPDGRDLQQVADEFEAENGRPPTFWLDKVCIDQTNAFRLDRVPCAPPIRPLEDSN